MSDPAVTAFLTKLLCANGGRLPRAQLTQYLELPQEQIDQILQEESERFPQAGELILAHCPIRICPEYIRGKEDKDDCGKLHLCCSHLRGTCWNSKKFTCKYSHNTQTEHNLAVLKANEVNSLNNEELKTILFQNDSSILPGTCKKYLHEKCDDDKCKWLHICGFFTSGVCNRKVCKKSHDLLETQTTLLLKQYGIPAVSIENLQMLSVLKYNANLQNQTEQDGNRKARGASRGRRGNRGRSHIRKGTRKRDSKKIDFTEICLANIWKYCKHEGNCPKMHYYLPYRWQVSCGSEWNDLEDMENIEKAYCDPKITSYFAVDFLKMKSRLNSVRRLCTPSSVLKHHEFVLTTEWLWYWRDENGIWVEYGKANTKQMSASITSAQLENIYLSNPEDTISFRAGQQLYQINFADMKQKNIFYNTKRDMCRRPKFLSYQDVRNLKGSTRSASTNIASSPLKSAEYPATWDKTAMPDIGHKLVDVPLASSEASSIQALFTKTLSGYVLKKISRVQNPSLWQLYQWKKEQILKTNCIANEKNLFHGTSSHNIPPICHENIDWRVCGANGTLFGQGSYFARDASYSHNYSPKNASGQRSMFMARVLVGDYVLGNPSYKRPPSKPGSQTQSFNSCVDDKHHPSIFVVFESAQIYPEYLIMYEEEKKSCSIS
uniref:Poly [ADP-ribose] polymerase n=1 Tax=Leptobrachium leishanense TaxID=445787 RepID=A0A8C5PLM9_9ANUR